MPWASRSAWCGELLGRCGCERAVRSELLTPCAVAARCSSRWAVGATPSESEEFQQEAYSLSAFNKLLLCIFPFQYVSLEWTVTELVRDRYSEEACLFRNCKEWNIWQYRMCLFLAGSKELGKCFFFISDPNFITAPVFWKLSQWGWDDVIV